MNLAQIRSAVPEIGYFIHKQKATDWRCQKQSLPQFTAFCDTKGRRGDIHLYSP